MLKYTCTMYVHVHIQSALMDFRYTYMYSALSCTSVIN